MRWGGRRDATPPDLIAAARKTATKVLLAEVGARSEKAKRVGDLYAAFRARTAAWSRTGIKAVLEAREG